ncbi:MAG: GIY-YIG nuclease family protein [Pseudanabaenaceae cyanobacterium bins.68]|nr:GIY-YIG nuclease family protein [Pseudanabaenaceae cyanobacterium bins.68]
MSVPIPELESLVFLPYLTPEGDVDPKWAGKIGVYGIFDQAQVLQYVGFSRDLASSLRLHLVRVCDRCVWLKVFTVDKPSRSLLIEIQAAWWGNQACSDPDLWEQPLNCLPYMNDQERQQLAEATSDREQDQVRKDIARRLEQEIMAKLAARGVTFKPRFDPKRKNAGILDLKTS